MRGATTKLKEVPRSICLTAVLMCVATLFAMCGYAQPLDADMAAGPRLTQTQAVQIAKDFCQKIGQPVTVPGKATFPITVSYDVGASWLPMWSVIFSHQAEVHIVDRTGTIINYSNDAYFYRPDSGDPPGQPLSREEALRLARAALADAGEQEELGNETAEVRNGKVPPSYQGNEWDMKWDRMSHGVPYLDEGIGLGMNAQTGEIEAIVTEFPSPPLAGTEAGYAASRAAAGAGVTPAQAVGVGAEYLAAFDSAGRPPYRAVLREPTPLLHLVRPKDGWSHFQDAPDQSRSARPAWVVRILFRIDKDYEQDVWVDAETGEVLGEDHYAGGLGAAQATAPSPVPSLAQMLGSARSVCVLPRPAATKAAWRAAAPLSPGGKDQAPALAALRAAADFRTDAPAGDAPQRVVLVGQDNAVGTYSYYPETGLLGRGGEWAVVPAAFRAWARKQIIAAPVKKIVAAPVKK